MQAGRHVLFRRVAARQIGASESTVSVALRRGSRTNKGGYACRFPRWLLSDAEFDIPPPSTILSLPLGLAVGRRVEEACERRPAHVASARLPDAQASPVWLSAARRVQASSDVSRTSLSARPPDAQTFAGLLPPHSRSSATRVFGSRKRSRSALLKARRHSMIRKMDERTEQRRVCNSGLVARVESQLA